MLRRRLVLSLPWLLLAACTATSTHGPADKPAPGDALATTPAGKDAHGRQPADLSTLDPQTRERLIQLGYLDGPGPKSGERPVLLQRVDDIAVAQLYADGFENLSVDDQRLCWHLTQAAIAGRDIFLHQRCADGPALRDLLEELLTHPAGMDAATLAELQRYTTLFWVNNGPHNSYTSRKNLLALTPEQLDAAVAQGRRNGADAVALDPTVVARLRPLLFDPAFQPMVTAKNPEGGLDIVQGSANSFYGPGVTLADLEEFTEQHELNSNVVKSADGKLAELVWRAGSPADKLPPGPYARELRAIIGHLTDALPFAPAATATALEKLIRFYRTGEVADREAYDIAWVADDSSAVDTVNGFIEVYVDPRGKKGSWEGIVAYEDPHKAALIKRLAETAQWFEDRMPYAPEFRKPKVKGISARSIDVVCETGDSGPVTPIGINLPNDQRIREDYGSKSVSLANVVAAGNALNSSGALAEFCWDADEAARSVQWSPITADLLTNMHEVIGHASGQQDEAHQGDPATWIKEDFSALEEARADLVGLYFMGDAKLKELGLVEDPDAAARAAYESYTRNGLLLQLRRVRVGNQIEEDHMRNRQMVAGWIRAHGKAIEERSRGGRRFFVVVDAPAWREAAGRLLAEVQRIKSTGDREAARKLFDDYGDSFDPALRDEVVARYAKLDVPSYIGFVQPRLSPVWGADGSLADVAISYPLSLRAQMLEWSGRALPPLALPEDPAALLHTVEHRLLDAPELALDFDVVSDGTLVAHKRGTLSMRAGNVLDLVIPATPGTDETATELHSDGSRYVVSAGATTKDGAVPERLNTGVVKGLVTRGLMHNLYMLGTNRSVDLTDGTADGLELRNVSALPDGEVNGEPVRRIAFTAHVGDRQIAEITLDVSKATGLPVHRDQTVHFPEGNMHVVESYSLKRPVH
ncbi:MAG TPA: hypothetical protein VK824_07110 [Planctomycetota bacterium]|nr:hypothetical protein [Planctomycetota bacterium]